MCLTGFLGFAHAQDVKSAAAEKTGYKVSKIASAKKAVKTSSSSKSAKLSKSTLSASDKKPLAEAGVPAQPGNPYLSYQNTNPYLANQPVNPFFASQAANPYLAYRYEKPNTVNKAATSDSSVASRSSGTSRISFAPMPVTMYLQPNQRPIMAIATPCSAMEKMTGNNPMFKAMEQMAFGMIGNMNEAGFMPMIIEPVCT